MTAAVLQAPGVYTRGAESAAEEITPTAIAGFVGIAERGPIGVPQTLRSWGDYLDVFGNYIPYGHLAETVFAFFLNGGERCWVVRCANTKPKINPPGQCPRVELLASAKAIAPIVDRNNDETLQIEAINPGSWGNLLEFAIDQQSTRDMDITKLRAPVVPTDTSIQVESALDIEPDAQIRLTARGNPLVVSRCDVASVDTVQRKVTLKSAVGSTFPTGTTVSGRGFRIQFRYGEALEIFDHLSMTNDHPRYFVEVIQGDPNVLSYVERRERGHSILARVTHVRDPASGDSRLKPRSTASPQSLAGGGDGFGFASVTIPTSGGIGSMELFAKTERGTSAQELRVTVEPFQTITALPVPVVPGGTLDDVIVEDARGFAVGESLTLSFMAPNGALPTTEVQTIDVVDLASNRLHVATPFGTDFPIAARAFVLDRFDVIVHRGEQIEPVERFRNLSGDPTDGPHWFRNVINNPDPQIGSRFLCANDPGPGTVLVGLSGTAQLENGLDPGTIDYRCYTGYEPDGKTFTAPGSSTALVGLAALEPISEVSLVAIPDLHRIKPTEVEMDFEKDFDRDYAQAQRDILHHCELTGGSFGLLDSPPSPPKADSAKIELWPAKIELWPLQFAESRPARNGALYFPWVTGAFGDARRLVPPCGFVAGQIAATDRQAGVGKAPANGTLKGVVALDFQVDRELQHRLNPAGVNCLRKFEDGQVRVFGARTLSQETRFQYVNVRRVLLAVVPALTRQLLWAVFEPNDDRLQRRIKSAVTGYLNSLVARGATASPNPAESFYVKCDAETNPTELREAGQVLAEIGIAIAAPAEYIVLTARKSPESLSIVEEDV